ncbi:MAG: gamma-glutamylcyclotransferase, partial [Rhodobacteraceae bacterium]|nr:gamma-glutamylcyclotransferase [Paracoccaceae bacterium]
GADPLGTATLPRYKLRFCRYADIVPDNEGEVLGAIFKLTPACVRALDSYEGPEYAQITVHVVANGRRLKAMAYAMQHNAKTAPPDMDHYREIARGYQDWKLDEARLRRARYDTLQTSPDSGSQSHAQSNPQRRATWDPAASPSGDVIRSATRRNQD